MTLGLAYWILMLVWLAFGVYTNRAALPAAGGDLLLFILLVLLGWKAFGPPIHS
jgi:hypothetical protein